MEEKSHEFSLLRALKGIYILVGILFLLGVLVLTPFLILIINHLMNKCQGVVCSPDDLDLIASLLLFLLVSITFSMLLFFVLPYAFKIHNLIEQESTKNQIPIKDSGKVLTFLKQL